MKKLVVLLVIVFSIVSCNKENKNYARVSGHLVSLKPEDTIMKIRLKDYSKEIKINSDGNFNDTLKVNKPEGDSYVFMVNNRFRFNSFLKNGYDLIINEDTIDPDIKVNFKGKGSITNNYLVKRIKKVMNFNRNRNSLIKLDSIDFYKKVDSFELDIKNILSNTKGIDTMILHNEEKGLGFFLDRVKSDYEKKHKMEMLLAKGKPSPKFTNYENFKGGKTSLDDFKGKYVYIDVWATWCRPCLGQIPALKELEKEYHGKNIEFVSISSDKPEKHQAWINMIKSKDMGGTQLFAGKDLDFMRAYQINSIPRFIFIGKNGEILNANAPRPSQKEAVKAMFEENGLK
jgi:thiol-disulfide isomerase/thioredoxin